MHTAVDDALAGLVMTNPGVMLLEAERAVMRRDHRQLRGRVMLVSGGASGHEPYPAGYVGSGMLTAAVVGDVSAAPPPLVVVKVVRGLLENHPEGVLLVVGYRPGDRLSFTVAAEILSSEGLPVRLVLVDGMTGAVLIFKLAGAMAEKGASLEELFTMCSRAVADLISIDDIPELSSVLHHCKCVPDIQNEVIDEGEGINCERASVVITPEVVQTVQKQFGISSPPFQDLLVTLLVNNMGQAHKLHEQAFAMKTTKQFLSHGYKVKRLYCGSFATSFKGKGFSVSVLKMCGDLTELLDAPTSAPAWPRTPCPACWEAGVASDQLASPGRGVVDASEGSRVAEVANSRVLQIVLCTVQAVVACREQLDMLDSGEGDGDCGTTLGRGAQAVMKAISDGQLNCESPSALLSGLSCVCGRTMGGVSGALYYVLFSAAAQELGECAGWTVDSWTAALRAGVAAVRKHGGAADESSTMLASLAAASAAADRSAACRPGDGVAAARRAAEAAELAALRTSGPSRPRRHPDPGAHAVGILLRAVCEGLQRPCHRAGP